MRGGEGGHGRNRSSAHVLGGSCMSVVDAFVSIVLPAAHSHAS